MTTAVRRVKRLLFIRWVRCFANPGDHDTSILLASPNRLLPHLVSEALRKTGRVFILAAYMRVCNHSPN